MKKIFLTSGLVLCMACPAYATASYEASIYSGENPDLVREGTCEETHLGVTSGSTILKAIWTVNKGTVNLNNGSSYTQQNCTTNKTINHTSSDNDWSTIFTAANPAGPLATTYGIAVFADTATQSADTNNTGVGGITALTSSPTMTGYVFQGYYSAATGGTKYINGVPGENDSFDNGDFVLESTNDQDDPRYGHALLDQYVSESGGTGNLYAHWTPKTYTIAYNCGVLAEIDSQTNQPVAVQRESDAEDTTVKYDDCYSLDTIANQCGTAPSGYTFGGWQCTKTTTGGANAGTVAFSLPGASMTLPASTSTADLRGYPSAIDAANMLYAETTSGNSTVTAGGVWTTDLADNESVTCTAIWRANSIDVIWTSDGTTSYTTGTPTPSCTYDGDVKLPTKPERTGYTFGGWEVQAVPTAQECQAADNALLGC